jgi:hypothetical protein
MRIGILILAAFVFTCLLRPVEASAADVTLNLLNGINPGGIANMDLPVDTYDGGVYVGMLNWTVATDTIGDFGKAGSSVNTYCIDTASIIYASHTYAFDVKSASYLATGGSGGSGITTGDVTYSTALVGAIEYLFAHGTYNTSTTTGNSNAGNTSNTAGISNDDAETFQMALWDLINGWSSTGLKGDLAAQNPYDGGSSTDIANAYLLATQAMDNGVYSSTANFEALIADDGGQNQAIIFNELTPNTGTSVPLPSVASTGIVLLSGVAGLAFVRRRFTAPA